MWAGGLAAGTADGAAAELGRRRNVERATERAASTFAGEGRDALGGCGVAAADCCGRGGVCGEGASVCGGVEVAGCCGSGLWVGGKR